MKVFKKGGKEEKKASYGKSQWNLITVTIISFVAGGCVVMLNFLLFRNIPQVFAMVNLMAGAIILGVPLTYKYDNYKSIKKIELIFPKYLRDISENISTGMTLPQAMKTAANNDYDIFTPYAKEMSAKVSWGIPLEKVLHDFATSSGSKNMKRNVQTIVEAHRSGGTIDTILKSAAQSLQELERIKKERSASVYSQMINGYLIYVIFLGVMIGLATILVPSFTRFGGGAQDIQAAFIEIFRSLTIIQGFFAGIAIGKMAEGTVVAGIKHALALVVFGYSVFVLFG